MDALHEIMAAVRADRARIDALVAAGERAISFQRRNTGPVLVSPDPSKPGRWRATRFDIAMQPVGHAEAGSFCDALEAARHAGAIFTVEAAK